MSVDHQKSIISVQGLSFSYGQTKILDDVNLEIHQGDYLGVIGPNGGGKTTLLKLILGLLKPEKGRIKIFGTPLNQFSEWRKIGYVGQKVTAFDRYFPITVAEVVAMGRVGHKKWGLADNKQDLVVKKALQQVGMLEYSNRLVGALSGGQQQRVFIARSLAQESEILFLDEPTSGIDANAQEDFYTLLSHLNKKEGMTLIIVSHEQDLVRNEVTEVACVNQHLTYHGSTTEFLQSSAFENLYGKNMKTITAHRHD